jgi:predicted AlkP superfamily phosphohydrolase/phosphomutase
MTDHERVLILGLDGVPWSLLDPWLADGKLPNLARLIAGGARGDLTSTIPYVTAPAWVSCVTGVNPGKHGVLDFAMQRPNDSGIDVVNSTSVRARTLWDILSERGQRVGMLNVPVTYPPRPVNGVMVTCMLTPSLKTRFTYPDALREPFLAAVPSYAIEPMTPSSDLARTKSELARNLAPTVEARAQATRWLMEHVGDWHFFMTVFTEPDRLMTYGWDDFDERHPRHSRAGARLYGDLFLRHYQHLDRVVGEFMAAWQERATIIIVSDHGFAGVHRFFYPNVWLQQNGYLALNEAARPSAMARVRALARRLGVAHLAKKLAKRVFPDWGFTTGARNSDFVQAVDWQKTRVYWGADNGLTINLKGRQPHGVVEPADYESLRDEIIARWSDLRDARNGERVVARIYRREDIYHGPYVERSPDLRVVWQEYPAERRIHCAAGELWAGDCWGYSGQTGDHAPVGIIIAGGRNIAGGTHLSGAQIADIAPTVLYALGQPPASGMDGRVLSELFTDGFRDGHPLPAPNSTEGEAATESIVRRDSGEGAAPYSSSEQAEVEERLKALGYLD